MPASTKWCQLESRSQEPEPQFLPCKLHIKEIRKVTLSLGLLSTPNPSFSGIRKVRKFY